MRLNIHCYRWLFISLGLVLALSYSHPAFAINPSRTGFDSTQPLQYKYTLAVMPLENLTKSAELDWLSAGIPESLISKLQNIRSLRLVERIRISKVISEIRLGQAGLVSPETAQKAGKMLGADTVLIGSFAEFRGTIRVPVRLVKVETAQIITATESTGLLDRIFQLQDRLAEKLVANMGLRMGVEEKERMTRITTTNDAYELYVRGRDHYFKFNREGYERAVELYKDAIRIDPNFALAYAGIADSLATLGYSRQKDGESYRGLYKEAKQAAETAIALNPNLSDGHRALAHVYLNLRRFSETRYQAEKALSLNPNDPEAWYMLAQVATDIPDLDKAQRYYTNAIQLNPDYAMAHNNLGWYVYLKRRWYDRAIDEFKRAIQISPDFAEAHDSLGETYYRMKRYEEAAESFQKAVDIQPNHKNAVKRLKQSLRKIKK